MIEASIHEIVTGTDPDAIALRSVLSADKIVTGTAANLSLPYCSISVESNLAEYRANAGTMRKTSIRFTVFHEDHAQGCEIRDAIERLFENKEFDVLAGRLALTRHVNSMALQEDDGVWQFMINIDVTTSF